MRRKLTPRSIAPLLVAGLVAIGGCSHAAPLPGPPGSGAASHTVFPGASASGGTVSSGAAPRSSAGSSLTPGGPSAARSGSAAGSSASGLSDACTDVTAAQAAVSGLFDRPLNGHRLTAEDVAAVFDRLGGHIPAGLSGAIAAIHDAAGRAVGASEVAVTDILNEKKVADALSAVSAFVRGCAPATG